MTDHFVSLADFTVDSRNSKRQIQHMLASKVYDAENVNFLVSCDVFCIKKLLHQVGMESAFSIWQTREDKYGEPRMILHCETFWATFNFR